MFLLVDDGFEGWNVVEAQGGTIFLLDQKLDRISMPGSGR